VINRGGSPSHRTSQAVSTVRHSVGAIAETTHGHDHPAVHAVFAALPNAAIAIVRAPLSNASAR